MISRFSIHSGTWLLCNLIIITMQAFYQDDNVDRWRSPESLSKFNCSMDKISVLLLFNKRPDERCKCFWDVLMASLVWIYGRQCAVHGDEKFDSTGKCQHWFFFQTLAGRVHQNCAKRGHRIHLETLLTAIESKFNKNVFKKQPPDPSVPKP